MKHLRERETERKNEKKGERKERTEGRGKKVRDDAKRLEGLITFTDTRGQGEGEMLVSCSTNMDEGYFVDGLETQSCQPSNRWGSGTKS